MYKKFKDCLLKPSRIGNYVDEKFSRTLMYFLLLLLIYTLPSIVSLYSINEMPSQYSSLIVESFSNSEVINYKIVNCELISINDESKSQYVDLGTVDSVGLNLIVVFNLSENFEITNYQFNDNLIGKNALVIVFEKDGLWIESGQIYKGNNNIGAEQLSNISSSLKFTYEELGIKNIDFSKARYNKTSFKNELDNVCLDIYNKNKVLILGVGISGVIIYNTISMLIEIFILAAFIKILYFKFNIKYSKICKIVILAYTPQIIFNLLSIFWSSVLMHFLGQILTVIYIVIAIKYYSLNSLVKDLSKNFVSVMEENSKNEGDEHNEL